MTTSTEKVKRNQELARKWHYCCNYLYIENKEGERGEVQLIHERCSVCGTRFQRQFFSG